MPSPALAIMWARQQAIDERFIRHGRTILNELLHLLGRRRKPEQIKVKTSDQYSAIIRRIRNNSLGCLCRINEPINRRVDRTGIFCDWQFNMRERSVRPMPAVVVGNYHFTAIIVAGAAR